MPAIYSKEALGRRRAEALRRSEQLRREAEEAQQQAVEEMRKMIEKPGYLDAQMDAARWLGVADAPERVRPAPDVMVQTEPLVNRLGALPAAPSAGATPPPVWRPEPRAEPKGWIRGATRPEPKLEPPGPDAPRFDWPVLTERPAQIHWPTTPGPRGIHRLPARPAPAPEREEPRHGRFGPGWVRPPAVAPAPPAPEREEPRHGRFGPGWVRPPLPAPVPPAPPPHLPEVRMVKTVPVAPSDRPQGSIGRDVTWRDPDPDLRLDTGGPWGDDQFDGLYDAYRRDEVALEGEDFWRNTQIVFEGPRRQRRIPDPNVREPRSLDIALSSLLDDPEDKKRFFEAVLKHGNPNAVHLQYFDGELYQLGKDGKFYLVVPPDVGPQVLSGVGGQAAAATAMGSLAGGVVAGKGGGPLASAAIGTIVAGLTIVGRAQLRDYLLHEYVKNPGARAEDVIAAMGRHLTGRVSSGLGNLAGKIRR